jgi:hypothetical protein
MDLILDLLTPLRTTRNYSATAHLHALLFTTATAKPFTACCVLTSRSLATASNSGDSSASRAQVLLSQRPVQNSCQFPPNCQLSRYHPFSIILSAKLKSFTTGGLPPISSSWRQPLETHDHRFFFLQLNPCCYSPYVTFSLARGWVCLL